jgi:hypothetical protein
MVSRATQDHRMFDEQSLPDGHNKIGLLFAEVWLATLWSSLFESWRFAWTEKILMKI